MAPKAKAAGHLAASIQETINYLDEILADAEDSAEKTNTIADHITTLIKSIANEQSDLPDATQALKIVRENATMLGQDNIDRLRNAIARSTDKGLKSAGKRKQSQPDVQEHSYIQNYLTDSMWTMLKSDQQFETKMSAMAEFLVDTVGVHYPRELSYTSIVGVIIAAHGKGMSFGTANKHLWAFKGMVKARRELHLSQPAVTRYPESVDEFVSVNPGRYSPAAMPVECPLSDAMITSGRYLVAARANNKKLKSCDDLGARDDVHSMISPSRMINQAYQEGVASGLQKAQGKGVQLSLAAKSVIDVDRKPSFLAIADEADVHEEAAEVVDDHEEADDLGEGDVEDELLAMRKKIAGIKGDAYSKAAVSRRMNKKPAAAVIKRPAAAIIKRPAADDDGPPAQPPLKSRFKALSYKGCKIYWGGDRLYRVLTAHKAATINFSWPSKEEAPAVWDKVIACCEKHAR